MRRPEEEGGEARPERKPQDNDAGTGDVGWQGLFEALEESRRQFEKSREQHVAKIEELAARCEARLDPWWRAFCRRFVHPPALFYGGGRHERPSRELFRQEWVDGTARVSHPPENCENVFGGVEAFVTWLESMNIFLCVDGFGGTRLLRLTEPQPAFRHLLTSSFGGTVPLASMFVPLSAAEKRIYHPEYVQRMEAASTALSSAAERAVVLSLFRDEEIRQEALARRPTPPSEIPLEELLGQLSLRFSNGSLTRERMVSFLCQCLGTQAKDPLSPFA